MEREPASQPPSFSSGRKWGARFNMLLAAFAVAALVGMANYLAARHARRLTLGAGADFQLSPLTLQVLRGLTNHVKVTVYFDPEEVLYSSATALLREYSLASPKIIVDSVNYLREPAKAELIKAQYKLPPTMKDFIIVEHEKRARLIHQGELSEYDFSKLMRGESREIQRKGFNGERLITSALINVTEARKQKAYFLAGHGEHNPTEQSQDLGYGRLVTLLQDNNIEAGRLLLTGTNDLPADCNLLVIPGPMTPFDPGELDKLGKYLNQGGRMFLLMRYQSRANLERFLSSWNVDVGDNVVLDRQHSRPDGSLLAGAFGNHPVVKPLNQAGLVLQVVLPRSVGAKTASASSADAPQLVELVTTTPNGVAVTDLAKGARPSDREGAIPLMVAVEKGSIKGVNLDRGSTRMLVCGDSFMLDNQMIEAGANRDFAWQAVNWLLDRSHLQGSIGPRPLEVHTFTMSQGQMQRVRWLLIGGLPGAILVFGLLVWFRRQR